MKRLWIIFFCFTAIFGCREPFEFDYEDIDEPKVVIEGFITDRGTQHEVRVSYTATINDFGIVETQFIEDASVRIEDDQGGFTNLTHREAGKYLSAPLYRAQEGRTYTVVVTLANGEVYQSAPKTMPAASPATARLEVRGDTRPTLSNERIQEQGGAAVTVTIDKDNERHFYQWLIGHYYIYESDLASDFRFCYVRDFDESRVLLLQDNPMDAGGASQYSYEIEFIPLSAKMEHEFGVEGRLLTMTEDDYNFWDKVRRLAENTGGLFDAAPFSLEGNITNRNTGELALGYFGVYRESIDRQFFQIAELGVGSVPFPMCTIPPFATLPHPCEDCRVAATQENFGNVRPVWWGN